jgi:hypothetical protein
LTIDFQLQASGASIQAVEIHLGVISTQLESGQSAKRTKLLETANQLTRTSSVTLRFLHSALAPHMQ